VGVGRRWFVDSGSPRQGGLLRHPAGRRGYPVRLLLVGGGEVAQWAQVGVRGLSEGVAAVEKLRCASTSGESRAASASRKKNRSSSTDDSSPSNLQHAAACSSLRNSTGTRSTYEPTPTSPLPPDPVPLHLRPRLVELTGVPRDSSIAAWQAGQMGGRNCHLPWSQPSLASSIHAGDLSMCSRQPGRDVGILHQRPLGRTQITTAASQHVPTRARPA